MMKRLAPFFYTFRIPLFILSLIVAVFLGSQIRFEMNTRIDAWFSDDDPVSVDYRFFRDTFEGGNSLIIAVESRDIFSRDVLQYISAKTSELEQMDFVRRVTSLANANHVVGTEEGIEIHPLLHDIENTSPEQLKQYALEDELFREFLVSLDATMSAILVVFDELRTDQIEPIIEETASLMARGRPEGITTFLGGGLMISSEFIKVTRQNQTLLPALGVIVGTIIIYILFRSIPKCIILQIQIAMTLLWTLGFHSLIGFTYNPVSGMIIPLIVILSLSNSIHMIEYYDEVVRSRSPKATFIATVSYITIPCFIASITTTFGLLSLSTSPIKAVKQFGITSGVGILFSFVIALITVPFLLTLLPKSRQAPHTYWGHMLSRTSALSEVARIPIIAVSVVVILFAFIGLKQVQINSNELDWFPEDSELHINSTRLDTSLAGIGNIELVLQGETDMLKNPDILSKIDTLSRKIDELPRIRKVISLADYVKAVNRSLNEDDPQAYRVPDTRELIAQELLLFSLSETGTEELEKYTTVDYSTGRISIHLKYTSSEEVRSLIAGIENLIEEIFPGNSMTITMTGFSYIFSMIDKYIVESQIRSFTLAFLLVFGILFLVMWSVRYGLLSIIPNVMPILLIIGIMGWVGISLNVGTVMIASVALGIAVDDTTHLLTRFRKEFRAPHATIHSALRRAIILTGRAMVFTSLIAICGFCIVVISDFQPSREFGILLSLTLFVALVSDLLLLPSCMVALSRRWPGLFRKNQ
ncbi:MAG: efflux RND transporter permease subunit [Desulfomonilia bacterium]